MWASTHVHTACSWSHVGAMVNTSQSQSNLSDHACYQINKNADLIYPCLSTIILWMASGTGVPLHLTTARPVTPEAYFNSWMTPPFSSGRMIFSKSVFWFWFFSSENEDYWHSPSLSTQFKILKGLVFPFFYTIFGCLCLEMFLFTSLCPEEFR